MAKILKVDIINDAYSKMRISGLTVQPNPEELELALDNLEDMATEFSDRTMCAGYNFTEDPDPNDEAGITRSYKQAYSGGLAMRVLSNFGKQLTPELKLQADQAVSNMAARTALVREVQYPSRQPRGSGNTLRWNRWQQFYWPIAQAPQECSTHNMRIDEVNDYSESWADYLDTGETIDSYTRTVTDGLTVTNEVLATPEISFTAKATGTGYQAIEFTILTSEGRVDVRTVNFEVTT